LRTLKRLLALLVIGTAAFAYMDWYPIHYQWWDNGQWPEWAAGNFQSWSAVRSNLGTYVCPPCAAMAENYYFVYFEVQAGTEEQAALLKAPYSGNPLLPDGPRFWWGQGPDRESRPVSMLAWYLYWLPNTVLWWWLYAGDLLHGRWPWWAKNLRWARTR
jgi:hypothetical protein